MEGFGGRDIGRVTVVIATKHDEFFLQGGQDGCESVYGSLVGRVGFVERDGFRGCHVYGVFLV
jgi:hypothetical protein